MNFEPQLLSQIIEMGRRLLIENSNFASILKPEKCWNFGGKIFVHFFGSFPLNLPRRAADSASPRGSTRMPLRGVRIAGTSAVPKKAAWRPMTAAAKPTQDHRDVAIVTAGVHGGAFAFAVVAGVHGEAIVWQEAKKSHHQSRGAPHARERLSRYMCFATC